MMRDAYAQQESQKGISLDESDNSLENLFDEDDFLDDLNMGNKKNQGNMFAGSMIEESTNQNSKLQESTNTSSQIIEQDSTRAAFQY